MGFRRLGSGVCKAMGGRRKFVRCQATVVYDHIQMYSDRVQPLMEYKKLEKKLNAFSKLPEVQNGDIEAGRRQWAALGERCGHPVTGVCDPEKYSPSGQDVIEQMMVGLGFRIVGAFSGLESDSFVLASPDDAGVKFVITAHREHTMETIDPSVCSTEEFGHFDGKMLARFAGLHANRQGMALMAFRANVGDVDKIAAAYAEKHPKLLVEGFPKSYGQAKILEVFAYYKGEKLISDADRGTVLRFIEHPASEGHDHLPGVDPVGVEFDGVSQPAYFDHWVSNVHSRQGFLDTLDETLQFSPKVDFNAGVVAAGEAQIESTVTGNTSGLLTNDEKIALKDQSQVYLPINNALSEAGHVALFLKQYGQGIQHIAHRVEDLPSFIQKANDYRKMTGAGLSFLGIPRSYYGYLTAQKLAKDAGIDEATASRVFEALVKAEIVDDKNIVDLDATRDGVAAALPQGLADAAHVVEIVLRSRYGNLYSLLRDNVDEELYLKIVRNSILVDIQGEDLLLQIFTSTVLQRNPGEEAPFLEFIQRLCSRNLDHNGKPAPIRPGCGGFGIRNFLTLFLSIEVGAALQARAAAIRNNDKVEYKRASAMVDSFVAQLDESNPILTAISDAMTAEGLARDAGDAAGMHKHAALKDQGQKDLMAVSLKYKDILKKLREGN